MADFASVVQSIPPVTRFILASTALITLPCLLGALSPADVALSWWKIRRNYEIWRPFTAFFFGGSGFPLLYDFFLIYRNSTSLEQNTFFGHTAKYAWMHVVIGVVVLMLNLLLNLPFLFRPLLHAQTYIWCRSNPTLNVSIFGLITIPTSLYPPMLLLLDLLTGGLGKALGGLIGVVAGHFWWNVFAAPIRFQALFPHTSARHHTQQASNTHRQETAVDAARHRWGGGQKLGGSAL